MARSDYESRVFGSDTYQSTEGLLDNPHNAWQAITTPVLDLDDCQVVCATCRYVVNKHLPECPVCAGEDR